MTYVCLWSPGWSTGEGLESELATVLPAMLTELAPRIRVEKRRVWVDGRGLPVRELARALLSRLTAAGVEDGRVGVAVVPIAAELAARAAAVASDLEEPAMRAAAAMSGTEPAPGAAKPTARTGPPVPIAAELAARAAAVASDPMDPALRAAAAMSGTEPTPRAVKPTARTGPPVPIAADPSPRTAKPTTQTTAAVPVVAKPAPQAGPRARTEVPVPATQPAARPSESIERAFRIIDSGAERAFLAPLPLAWLEPDPRVLTLLEGVGIETCGELAARERGAVEVRFGFEGARLWRLARADDPRCLFDPIPPERPHASLDFVDYVVTDPERLVFTANALLGSICDALRARGEHARSIMLRLSLANGESWSHGLKPGRPTASRALWLRLARAVLERLTVSDAVAGMALAVEATEPATVYQGDLFDTGFATASAVEAAVLRLIESQGEVVVRPDADAHPLAERRTRWEAEDLSVIEQSMSQTVEGRCALTTLGPSSVRQMSGNPSVIERQINRAQKGQLALGSPKRQIAKDPPIIEHPKKGMAEDQPAAEPPKCQVTKNQPVNNGMAEVQPALGPSVRQMAESPSVIKRSGNGTKEGRPALGPPSRQVSNNLSALGRLITRGAADQKPSAPAGVSCLAGAAAPAAAHEAEVSAGAFLALQLLTEPRVVRVETAGRRDHVLPIRYRDREGWHRLVQVLGPDRVSGERWEAAFAREYYRAVREDGLMVWLFRDALQGAWYLHGWWD